MPTDLALQYDPAARRCDLVFDGTDFVLDATPATPMLVGLGTDRRANSDDRLPGTAGFLDTPTGLLVRGGTPLDALDPNGQLMGSRLWLLADAKQDEDTRQLGEDYAAEGLADLEDELSLSITLDVRWSAPNRLRVQAVAGRTTVVVQQAVNG